MKISSILIIVLVALVCARVQSTKLSVDSSGRFVTSSGKGGGGGGGPAPPEDHNQCLDGLTQCQKLDRVLTKQGASSSQPVNVAAIAWDDSDYGDGSAAEFYDAIRAVWPVDNFKMVQINKAEFETLEGDLNPTLPATTAALKTYLEAVDQIVTDLKGEGYSRIVLPSTSTFLNVFLPNTLFDDNTIPSPFFTDDYMIRHSDVISAVGCAGTLEVNLQSNVYRMCDINVYYTESFIAYNNAYTIANFKPTTPTGKLVLAYQQGDAVSFQLKEQYEDDWGPLFDPGQIISVAVPYNAVTQKYDFSPLTTALGLLDQGTGVRNLIGHIANGANSDFWTSSAKDEGGILVDQLSTDDILTHIGINYSPGIIPAGVIIKGAPFAADCPGLTNGPFEVIRTTLAKNNVYTNDAMAYAWLATDFNTQRGHPYTCHGYALKFDAGGNLIGSHFEVVDIPATGTTTNGIISTTGQSPNPRYESLFYDPVNMQKRSRVG